MPGFGENVEQTGQSSLDAGNCPAFGPTFAFDREAWALIFWGKYKQ
jgi:hypothetical protein